MVCFTPSTSRLPGRPLNASSVHSYDAQTARLVLNDSHASASSTVPAAIVNIDNILENVTHELLDVGAWINVIGTMREIEAVPKASKSGRSRTRSSKQVSSPVVDATMLWSAGTIKLEEYRVSVQAYQDALPPT